MNLAGRNVVSVLCLSCLASLISTMSLNDNKAGMQGLDKERINQIIYEVSKGQ